MRPGNISIYAGEGATDLRNPGSNAQIFQTVAEARAGECMYLESDAWAICWRGHAQICQTDGVVQTKSAKAK